ncbi:hypothetical protein N7490_012299 [Penicillium lividum]|nr:hypothetical protein N7490_012299 [Penicillium lividum]
MFHMNDFSNNIQKLRLGTRIKLPGFLSDAFPTETGIPQGSPISPILFLLFNAPLVAGCYLRKGDGAEPTGYAVNVEILQEALAKVQIYGQNDMRQNSHPTNPGTDQLPVQTANQIIRPSPHAKYLGICLDKQLNFNTHCEKLTGKANGSLEALRALTGPMGCHAHSNADSLSSGSHSTNALWRGSMVPELSNKTKPNHQLIYKNTKARVNHDRRRFERMSAAALNVELYLLPIRPQMEQILQETAIRIQTGAEWAQPYCLQPRVRKRTMAEIRLEGTPPLEELRWKKGGILFGSGQWESRTAFVLAPLGTSN